MHPFDIATTLVAQADGRFHGQTSPAYANMVGPFGGTIAAWLLQGALLHPARIGEPIALTVNFAGPLPDGEFVVDARAVRTNRSTQHWQIELAQAGEVAATASAVFALRRETWSAPEAAPPEMPPIETLTPAAHAGRPAWTQRYEMRFADGDLPKAFDAQERPDSVTRAWVRDAPPRPLDFASLAALADSFFPRIFLRRRRWSPIGTVSLTTYFHADAAMLRAQGARPVLGTARGQNFRNGYFDQTAQVWSDNRQRLASRPPVVYYRD